MTEEGNYDKFKDDYYKHLWDKNLGTLKKSHTL